MGQYRLAVSGDYDLRTGSETAINTVTLKKKVWDISQPLSKTDAPFDIYIKRFSKGLQKQ